MRTLAVLMFALLAYVSPSLAQTLTITTTQPITDASGSAFTGKVGFTPVTGPGGQTVSAFMGGGGQILPYTHYFNVTAGFIQSGATLADTATTSPVNLCFRVTYRYAGLPANEADNGVLNSCFQPSSAVAGSTNLSSAIQLVPPLDVVQTGPRGAPGQMAVGTVTGVPFGTPPTVTNVGTPDQSILNFQVPQGPAGSTIGIVDATTMSGSDIGAKITAGLTSCSNACVVKVPAGTYTMASTLTLPNTQTTYKLDLTGAVINYTGTGNAIETPTITTGTNHLDGITGGWIVGTASGKNGIHINPINHFYIDHVKVSGFTNASAQNVGNGILDAGGNSIEIEACSLFGNQNGIAGTEVANFASIAVHILDSDISSNAGWGIVTFDSHVNATQSNTWLIEGNVIESNGSGGIDLAHSNATTVLANHFEQGGIPIRLNNGYNGFANRVIGNFFITGSSFQVQVVNGFNTDIEWNYENLPTGGTPGACFVSVVNSTNITEQNNTVVSNSERCFPGTTPGWITQFLPTTQTGTVSNPANVPVNFPQGITAATVTSGGLMQTASGQNITTGGCFTFSTGVKWCSGTGAPGFSCVVGGSRWSNTAGGSGLYSSYLCHNGTWVGEGPVF